MVQGCSELAVRSWALSGVPLSLRQRIVDTNTNHAAVKGVTSEGTGFLGATLKNIPNEVIPDIITRAQ